MKFFLLVEIKKYSISIVPTEALLNDYYTNKSPQLVLERLVFEKKDVGFFM